MADKHECEFCKKSFVRERTLIVHVCEKKRRWLSRDDRNVRIGFASWVHWCRKSGIYMNKINLEYKDFMNSSEYIAFIKFGNFVEELKMSNYLIYIDFVIKNQYKLDTWFKDSTYEYFIKMNARQEPVEVAMQNTIKYMDKWSYEHQEEWTDFFKVITGAQLLDLIRSGRISPWLFFVSKKGHALLSRMTDEQAMLLDKFIDIKWWSSTLRRKPKDRQFVEQIVEEYGL